MSENIRQKKSDPAQWPDLTKEIIQHFGNIARMAKTLNCSRAAIYDWNGIIPESRAYEIEVKSKHKFTAERILESQKSDQAA